MRSHPVRWWLLALAGLAFALRLPGIFANTFAADEALFATWARLIAAGQDPLLQGQLVDKPPLLFYLQAAVFWLVGPADWAARLPILVASILLIPLTARLASALYSDALTTTMAAAVLAFAPLAIQLSATAYLDPLLTAFIVAALLAVARARSTTAPRRTPFFAAGVLFGLAAAVKYQAWLFLPLVIGLAAVNGWRRPEWGYWLRGFALVLVALAAWELARAGRLALWPQQVASLGGFRLAWSWELWPRLQEWAAVWATLLDSAALQFGLLLAVPPFLALLLSHDDRPALLDQLLIVYLLGYFLLHWFVAAPIWSRYALPAAPVAALVLSRLVARVVTFGEGFAPQLAGRQARQAWLALAAPLLLGLAQARPIGEAAAGWPAADQGAGRLAQFLDDAPYGTVLYDHWHSWQWRYYLFDGRVYLSWFPTPAALAEDLAVFDDSSGRRYLALPASPAALPVLRALNEAGFRAEPVPTAADMGGQAILTLYSLRRGQASERDDPAN